MRGSLRLLEIAVFCYLCWYLASAKDSPCKPPKGKPGCVCKTSNGTVDLTSIADHHDKPLFNGKSDVPDEAYYNYTYNPCYSFVPQDSEQSAGACGGGNVSACQISDDNKYEFALGVTDTETMYEAEAGGLYLLYTEGTDDRSTQVNLFCNESLDQPLVIPFGDHGHPLLYVFELHSKCCCPGLCGSGTPVGLIGLLLMVFSLVGFGLYFLIGFLVLKFAFHKEGTDTIPNKELWKCFPFLIKDGVMFTFGPCIRRIWKDSYVTI